jgi:hypothetical protein
MSEALDTTFFFGVESVTAVAVIGMVGFDKLAGILGEAASELGQLVPPLRAAGAL